MSHHRLLPVILSLVVLVFAGCSKEGRLAKQLAEGAQYQEAGDYDKAEVAYRNALQLDPQNTDAIAQLGILFADQGRFLQAGPLLTRAKELQPNNVAVRHRLALVQLAIKYVVGVREEATKVLELDPTHPEAPLLLVETATNPEEAAHVREQLLGLPASAREGAPVATALAALDLKLGKVDAAYAALQDIASREPPYAPAIAALGMVEAAKGNATAATTALNRAAELSAVRSPRRLQYVQWLMRSGDGAAAKSYLEQITQQAPDYLPAWMLLANIAATENDYDAAQKHLNRVLSRDANHPEALLLNGRLRLAKGEVDKAIAEFERALTLFPSSPQFLYQLAVGHATAGDNGKALAALNQALATAPEFVEAALLQARLHARTGDVSGAIVTLRGVVERRPEIVPAWLMLAEAYRSQNNMNGALGVYDELERRFPGQPQTPLLKGQVLLQLNRIDDARAAFRLSRDRAPDALPPLEHLVNADLQERKFDAALKLIADASAEKPGRAELHLLRAKVLMAAGRAPEAEADLKKAIELAPDSPAGYSMLAAYYYTTGRSEEALDSFNKVAERDPRSVQAHMMIGMLKQDQQKNNEALAAYEKVLEIDPRSAVALNNTAYLYSEEFGDLDKAFAAAQKARELQPHQPHMADTLGWIVFQRRQYPWALSLLREAAEKLPTSAEVQYHLGMVQYMMGIEEGAQSSLETSLSLPGDFDGAEDARARLAVLQIDPNKAGAAEEGLLKQALQERPKDPIALVRQGALRERSGNLAQATESYRTALEANPENVRAMVRLMQVLLKQDEAAKAVELGRNARKLAPEDPVVALTLGRAAYATKDYRWAYSLLQEVARKRPDDAEVQHAFGWSAYSLGQVGEAEQALRRALELGAGAAWAGDTETALQLIGFASSAEKAGAAAAEIERASKSEDPKVPAWMASGALAEFRSNPDQAVRAYERVLTQFPEFAPAKRRLVVLLSVSGKDDARAAALVSDARAAYRNDGELARAGGVVLYRTKDYTRALPLLRDAAAAFPSDAATWFYLGMTQRQLNDGAAAETLTKALELGLSNDLAVEAKAALES